MDCSDKELLRRQPTGDEISLYESRNHKGNFLECIRTRKPTICNPDAASYTMNAILAGGISLALKRNLRWDPSSLKFDKDDTANRLLSYTPRPPWSI